MLNKHQCAPSGIHRDGVLFSPPRLHTSSRVYYNWLSHLLNPFNVPSYIHYDTPVNALRYSFICHVFAAGVSRVHCTRATAMPSPGGGAVLSRTAATPPLLSSIRMVLRYVWRKWILDINVKIADMSLFCLVLPLL